MTVHSTISGGRATLDMLDGLPQEPAFPVEEYQTRLASVRDGMNERDIDVLLVQHPSNVLYLTGYQTFSPNFGECMIVPLEGDPTLLVPSPELGGALVHTWLDDRRGYAPDRSNAQYIADTFREKNLDGSKVGVEKQSHGLSAGTYEGLVAALPKAQFLDGSGIVEAVKTVKAPLEIAHIRAAAKTTQAGMAAAIDAAREGATDNDMAAAASEALVAAGSEYMCLSPVVTSGRRSGILHSTHKRNRLEKGDVLLLEMGGCIYRYSAPTMRTVFIGEPPAEARRMAEACLTALGNILSTIRAGVTADEVAQVGWESILTAGDGFVFHGNFGYAIGAGFPPTWADDTGAIMSGIDTVLRPGMVFHHPVALRRMGRYGTAFSETTVVTEDGCEVLTRSPREIVVR
ncbi:MAG: aminopeptidase P family protein [Dehalococcoidia bacterium]|nr:aminopeptidase P family protein [Dehalococcoidia bacterium]